MTVAQALEHAAGLGLARLDAQILLLLALGRDAGERAWLIAHDGDPLPAPAAQEFDALCARRVAGEPVAYLVGRKEFFGMDLMVDARVLVPRPETETLVEWALELMPEQGRVIDLGTGSGAIALAIKKARPQAGVEAVDSSAQALEVARANSQALGLDVEFREASWLDGATGHYGLIVSNPPYVRARDPHLAALKHEPIAALAAGADGMDDLRAIVAQSVGHLKPGGWLLLEHGYDQAGAVQALLAAAGFASIETRLDLAGIPRCSGGKRLELG